MTKREILSQVRGHIMELETLRASMEMIAAWAERITPEHKDMPIPDMSIANRTADGAATLAELELMMNAKLCGIAEKIAEAEAIIEAVPDSVDRAILELYYVQGKTWAEVGEAVGYTRYGARYRRDAALKKAGY